MAAVRNYVAIDLGAESGRVLLGSLENERLAVTEIHRFANTPLRLPDGLHWDTPYLWEQIKDGLRIAVQLVGDNLASIGLDTWGVDFGLLNGHGRLVAEPFHYRDGRTNGILEKAFARLPRQEIYQRTGIQFMQINSLYQLLTLTGKPELEAAHTLLFMPDLFNYWLSGVKANEYTIASTSQCLDAVRRSWSFDLLDKMGIPRRIFGEIVPAGTILGKLRRAVADETGCPPIPVIAVGCHDTASAVAAVPAETPDFIYLSSGTWSLMGIEMPQPVITPASLAYNVTNEGGVFGTIRLLKNIMGMWLLQQSRAEWAEAGRQYSYDQLTALAADTPAFGPFVQPNEDVFLSPGGMVGRVQQFCASHGQAVPHSEAQVARCILESLALEYRRVASQLDELAGRDSSIIHIVGGGARNWLLNQFTADCTRKTVVAGPVEATGAGNILVQAIALGHISGLPEGREIIRSSFTPQVYSPGEPSGWDAAYAKFTAPEAA
jgi:rhamnulokinase